MLLNILCSIWHLLPRTLQQCYAFFLLPIHVIGMLASLIKSDKLYADVLTVELDMV